MRITTIRDERVEVVPGPSEHDLAWQVDQYTQETIGVHLAEQGWEVFSTSDASDRAAGGGATSPVYLVRQ